ncbi:MAG: ABC transporter ATP-binding protein [Candidatus Omnitrophica bacterium]|nr:ABC transporter ATP-binding protein [Candidatus Omnitrophota bacterium]MBU1047145.1 ABC transporter ATP-binding protein [Candidatus Omnitrophota bacterium]MBU1630954.1 ABC transporter ATP-binding protein [Candidatus Omnitrophota bacterium]MBU1767497.1 ABC transporter ATP-binding protein [Candidatus Omnitrophota bacterium]MBU1889577.1 ABC transporter ATP-binding protein [Candidatus Omnitrophota bacterium]
MEEEKDKKREIAISVRNLSKIFNGRTVLKNINLDVYKGERLIIIGGSGCGKSTLLRCLINVHQPDSGSLKFFGTELVGLKDEKKMDEIRKRFGILFQNGALYNSLTVGENVALLIREHTNIAESVIDIMVKVKLELVGLRDFGNLMPSQISGGMQKRVALARAIALDPEVLFYDEPTSGLDPIMTAVIDELIVELNQKMNMTSVVITHDMASAYRTAHRIVMLYKGEVIAQGTPEEVKNSKDKFVQQFIQGLADGPIPLRVSSKDFYEDLLEGVRKDEIR